MTTWRRSSLVLVLLVLFAWGTVPGYAEAQKSKGSGKSATTAKKSTPKAKSTPKPKSPKTVKVREYTKKDGTKVEAHKRRPPGAGSDKEEAKK